METERDAGAALGASTAARTSGRAGERVNRSPRRSEAQKAGEWPDSRPSYGLSVKVELQTWTGKVGEVRLEHGRAVGSNTHIRRLIASTKIVEPETFDLLHPSEGERYLRALPAAFRGAYFVAVLVEASA